MNIIIYAAIAASACADCIPLLFQLQLVPQRCDDAAELRTVSIRHQAAAVGPALCSFALGVGLMIGQFHQVIRRSRAGPQRLCQVHHAASEGSEQRVRSAGVPLEGAPFGEDIDVGQALNNAQDLVAGSGGVHQLVAAAQSTQGFLDYGFLTGAQHHRQPWSWYSFWPGHRADVDAAAGNAPEMLPPPAVNAAFSRLRIGSKCSFGAM